eukprot:Nk52_evm11s287 gene=Nk52_evmTU11s287
MGNTQTKSGSSLLKKGKTKGSFGKQKSGIQSGPILDAAPVGSCDSVENVVADTKENKQVSVSSAASKGSETKQTKHSAEKEQSTAESHASAKQNLLKGKSGSSKDVKSGSDAAVNRHIKKADSIKLKKHNSWRLSAKNLFKSNSKDGLEEETKKGLLKLKDFDLLTTVGTGSFGRVFLAKHKASGKVCAIKVIRKEVVLKRRQLEHVMNEKNTLLEIDSPFIISCMGSFQDAANLYLVMEYVNGGELFTHLREVHTFGPDKARFYAAQVVLALEYMHEEKGMVYRDLKPENILLDKYGQIKLADFGFAKNVSNTRGMTWTLCGTPEYLAPEMILNKGHGKEVDYWALGILIYEMLVSQPPFLANSHYDMYENILACKINFPSFLCPDTVDLLKGLLCADRTRRLGSGKNSIQDIKDHPWFKDVDWEAMKQKKYRAPFTPPVKNEYDTSQFLSYKEEPIHDKPLKDSSAEKLFRDFDGVAPPHKAFPVL